MANPRAKYVNPESYAPRKFTRSYDARGLLVVVLRRIRSVILLRFTFLNTLRVLLLYPYSLSCRPQAAIILIEFLL